MGELIHEHPALTGILAALAFSPVTFAAAVYDHRRGGYRGLAVVVSLMAAACGLLVWWAQ